MLPATMDDDARLAYDPPARVQKLPSWLINELARRAQREVGAALAREGARRQHYTVLSSLADQGAASQADLGRRLWIDRSDLHAILGELEADGEAADGGDDLQQDADPEAAQASDQPSE